MRIPGTLVLLVTFLAGGRLAAQSLPPDSVFDRLIGDWVLRGTIARGSGDWATHFADEISAGGARGPVTENPKSLGSSPIAAAAMIRST